MTNEIKEENGGSGLPKVRRCAAEQVHLRMLLTDPGYAKRRAAIENQAWRAARMRAVARTGCTRIPVVVHVVYRTDAENISQAQIESQIEVLNAAFRRRNADIKNVPAPFQPLIGDPRLEFALATTDPAGNPTNGVTRTPTTVAGFTDDDGVKRVAPAWPADRYLNIWVCQLAGGLLGYAQFPGGNPATDGVVITHTAFGTTGTAAAPFNLGRTTVHEIGHWLNLFHIWGDDGTGCSGSDFVDDTPNQGGPNYGVPTFPTISCGNGPNGDMFMNYMDYVDDAAMVMFSAGQVVRMQATLDGPRAGLGTSIPCGPKQKFTDEPTKLKFRDDQLLATRKVLDDIQTLKFRDDPIGTHKVLDDPIGTNKVLDDPIGTHKVLDDPIGTNKALDDVKRPALDKLGPDGLFTDPLVTAAVTPQAMPPAAPFVLATPHHSRAWEQAYPGAVDATLAAYEAKLSEYEKVFKELAAAEAAGELSEQETERLRALYEEYTALGAEYQQLVQGGARSV